MKPKPKPRRYVGYLDGKPVNECQASSRMAAWEMLWGLLRRSNRCAERSRFVVEQEDLEKRSA